jgi:predicted nucleotidyltransferase
MSQLPFNMNRLVALCQQYHIQKLGVFGSVERGEDDEASDIDLLVHFSKPISLLEMVALERQFSEALGRPVDLLTEAALSPYLRERIRQDTQILYEA